MSIPRRGKSIVRELAKQVAEIAALPIQQQTADLWQRLNRLESARPMVMLQNGAWNEMLDDNVAECSDDFCRQHELSLRRILYQWQHMPGDMVVEDTVHCPIVVHDTGWGVDVNAVRPDHYFGAARFDPVMTSEADIERIQIPQVSIDWTETERLFDLHGGLYDGRKVPKLIRWSSCAGDGGLLGCPRDS